jgi:hypothetical protein
MALSQDQVIKYIQSDPKRLEAYRSKTPEQRMQILKSIDADVTTDTKAAFNNRLSSIKEDVAYRENPVLDLIEQTTRPKPFTPPNIPSTTLLTLPGQLANSAISNSILSAIGGDKIPEIKESFMKGITGQSPARTADVSEALIGGPRWLNETIGFTAEMTAANMATAGNIAKGLRGLVGAAKDSTINLLKGVSRDKRLLEIVKQGSESARQVAASTIGLTDDFISNINRKVPQKITKKVIESKILSKTGQPIKKTIKKAETLNVNNFGLNPSEAKEVVQQIGKKSLDDLNDLHKTRRAINDLTPESTFVKAQKKIDPQISIKSERLKRAKISVEEEMQKLMSPEEFKAYEVVNKQVSNNIKTSQKVLDVFSDPKKAIQAVLDKNSPQGRTLVKEVANMDKGVRTAWKAIESVILKDRIKKAALGVAGAGVIVGGGIAAGKRFLGKTLSGSQTISEGRG